MRGSALKLWIFSKRWPHRVQRYSYKGKWDDLFEGTQKRLSLFYRDGGELAAIRRRVVEEVPCRYSAEKRTEAE